MKLPTGSLFRMHKRYIIARLNDKILPADRGLFYEDPLNEFLQGNNIGTVTGGGTQLTAQKDIKFVDIGIELRGGIDFSKAARHIIGKLEQLGAPKGSKLILTDGNQEICFGKKEGIAIYLDELDESNEDFSQYNIDEVIKGLAELINTGSENQRFMELKNKKTVLYFYKDSFEEMRNSIAEYIETYPLSKYIKFEQIA